MAAHTEVTRMTQKPQRKATRKQKPNRLEQARADWCRATQKSLAVREIENTELLNICAPTVETFRPKHFLNHIGFPGQFPFTRGIHPTMYHGRRWTMRQYAGFGTAAETNSRYRYLLEHGSTGLSVAFDLPTQMGRDSDDPLAAGEVGRVGVAIDSIDDMETLFDSIPLDQISTSMTINSTAHILLALYLVVARRRNIGWDKLRGTVQNDILKEYIARGTYIYPPKAGLKLVADLIEFCGAEVPQWNTISISGYHIREAGSTAVQEIAFTLANGLTYVDNLLERGLKIDAFAPRLAFFFNCHNNFLEEVAKFRAARRIWASLMRDQYRAKNPASWMLRFHTQTAGSTLTAQQPKLNIVRTALQAMAAVLGGTQSLHTNSFDEALGLPSEEAALIALRTQQIIAEESGIAEFIDPLGGSYALEALTDRIETEVRAYLHELSARGGMLAAIEDRYPQGEIERAAFEYQRKLETGTQKIVGVNTGTEAIAEKANLLKVNPRGEAEQKQRLAEMRKHRNVEAVNKAMLDLQSAARAGENIMPSVISAVERNVTLGEISNQLREIFGEYRP